MTPPKPRQIVDLELCQQVANSCPAMALGDTAHRVERLFENAFADLEIRGRQFSLLVAIALIGPCTVARLAKIRDLSPTTLSRNLSRLERIGIVAMVGGADRRERIVSLTEGGQKKLMQALQVWRKTMDEIEQSIGSRQLASLRKNLRDLRDKLSFSS